MSRRSPFDPESPSRTTVRTLLWAWPLVLGLSVVALGCHDESKAQSKRPPVGVEVATVEARDVPVRLRAIGTVEAVNTVNVIAQVTGLIQQVHFKEGDFVKAGDLLFSIDTRPYSSNLAVAQAQVQRDRAVARQAEEDADRAAKLAAEGLTSAQEVSRAHATAAAAAAAVQAGLADVQGASINVQFARVRAPIDGRTGRLLVVAGNVVKANDSQPLVVIRSLVPIHVRFAVPEDNLPEIRRRMREGSVAVSATPRGAGGVTARGTLTFVENSVDPNTGTIDLKAEFANTELELWPGQFVDVAVELSVDRNAVVVPESAIQVGQQGSYAYVVGDDHKAHLRSVAVRRTLDAVAVLDNGLRAGERVVTEGQVKLKDGAEVRALPGKPAGIDTAPKSSGPVEATPPSDKPSSGARAEAPNGAGARQ